MRKALIYISGAMAILMMIPIAVALFMIVTRVMGFHYETVPMDGLTAYSVTATLFCIISLGLRLDQSWERRHQELMGLVDAKSQRLHRSESHVAAQNGVTAAPVRGQVPVNVQRAADEVEQEERSRWSARG